jgi:hypothetical protein
VSCGEVIGATGIGASSGVPGAPGATNARYGSIEWTIPYYAETGDIIAGHSIGGSPAGGAGATFWAASGFGYLILTAPVTRITLTPMLGSNFVAGSRATLYGMPF